MPRILSLSCSDPSATPSEQALASAIFSACSYASRSYLSYWASCSCCFFIPCNSAAEIRSAIRSSINSASLCGRTNTSHTLRMRSCSSSTLVMLGLLYVSQNHLHDVLLLLQCSVDLLVDGTRHYQLNVRNRTRLSGAVNASHALLIFGKGITHRIVHAVTSQRQVHAKPACGDLNGKNLTVFLPRLQLVHVTRQFRICAPLLSAD